VTWNYFSTEKIVAEIELTYERERLWLFTKYELTHNNLELEMIKVELNQEVNFKQDTIIGHTLYL